MKYLLTISLLVLFNPSIFSQNNIKGTAWEVSFQNETPKHIYLVGYELNEGEQNRYIMMHKSGYIFPTYDTPKTWTLKGKKVVFKNSGNTGYTLSGTINDEGNYISGVAMNDDGKVLDWSAKRID
jgi:hypothetical protein